MASALRQIMIVLLFVVTVPAILPKLLPLKLLRLMPILSSVISLQFAYDEYAFLSMWDNDSYRAQADALLPLWFTNWGPWGTIVVVASFPISIASGLANILPGFNVHGSTGATYYYAAGTTFAAAHLVIFGSRALRLLAMIRNGEPTGASTVSMRKWLDLHAVRSFTVDLPAAVCFIVAGLLAVDAH